MDQALLLIMLGIIAVVFFASRRNNREYGRDADGKGCRDCIACTRPGYQRLLINITWGLVRTPFVFFISTCPLCSHASSKHGKRSDGSFLD